MSESTSDGRCLQIQIRSGIRYQWAITDFTKFHTDQYLESCPLFFQNADQEKSFKLKIIKAHSNTSSVDATNVAYFLHFNFGNTCFEESNYNIHYCICNESGDQLTKLESIQLQIAWGKVAPFYLNFITENDLREIIDRNEIVIVDVFMLDVTIPSIIRTESLCCNYVNDDDDDDDKDNDESKTNVELRQQSWNVASKNFQQIFKHDTANDMMLLVRGQKFLVHKIVLMAKSPTFSIILLPKLLNTNQVLCMTIDDFEPRVVAKMLAYMYLNTVDNIDGIVFDVYRLARKYHLDELIEICTNRIAMGTNTDNAITVFVFAIKQNAVRLIDDTKKFIGMNIDKVLDSARFRKMIDRCDFQEHGL